MVIFLKRHILLYKYICVIYIIYIYINNIYIYIHTLFVCLHQVRHMSEPHSLASGFLHYCSCACIRHLAKLHTVPSGYYSSTRNFQTTRYFPIFVPEYMNATWFFFHLFFCFTYLFSFS